MIDVNRNFESPEHIRRLLEETNAALRRDQELAEAKLERLNRQLRELHRWDSPGVPSSKVRVCRTRRSVTSATASAFRAALTLPGGLGAVTRDRPETAQETGPRAFVRATESATVVPFAACEPAVWALLAPPPAALLDALLVRFHGGALEL